jgi:anti-sigma B factor antagonist
MHHFQLLLSEPSEGTLVLNLSGELDLATIEPLRDATHKAITTGGYSLLIFDMTQLEFIDSTGLHALAEAHRGMALHGGDVTMIGCRPNVLKVLELTGLTQLFTMLDERPASLAA